MARTDLLVNGGLGEAFAKGDMGKTAVFWSPWWVKPAANGPDWQNRQPVYDAYELDNTIVQQLSTPWGTHVGGLWQQVPTALGNQYELTAEGQGWSSEDALPGHMLEGADPNLQIGVDPTGGLDPKSPLVVWSDPKQPLGRWETLRLTIESEAAVMTVYLRSAPSLPKRQQSVFWRNVDLRPIGPHKRAVNIVGAGDTHITVEPEQPEPGQAVTVLASSTRRLTGCELWLQDVEGAFTAVSSQGTTQDGERTVWRYQIEPNEAGLYELRFVGEGGARLLALRLLRVEREVQLVPSSRTTYQRVYVLLPPTADQAWFVAAAKGGFNGRFTIGFSADDAGGTDLPERHVIAVNPHHWPDVLTENWFQQHYPGVNFTAVVANKPADLEAWLRAWIV
ncbi:MAG: hypothetical protein AAF614_12895 [Chloroflexota bacterium]